MVVVFVLLLLILGAVVFQDFKSRAIDWYLPFLLMIGFFSYALENSNIPIGDYAVIIAINSGFLLVQMLVLTIYFSLKASRWVNIIDKFIGLGDILVLVSFSFIFSPGNFILFFTFSFFLAAFFTLIFTSVFGREKMRQIPLAGILCFQLAVVLVVDFTSVWSTFDELYQYFL